MKKLLITSLILICPTLVFAGQNVTGNLTVTGNVGVGSMVPTQSVDVAGTVKALTFIGDGSQLTGIVSGSSQWSGTSGSPISYAHNVGIGTVNPVQLLEVIGTVKANAFVGDGSGLTGISGGGASGWTLGAGNVGISTTNNVGVGSALPTQKLDVIGTVKATAYKGSGALLTGLSPVNVKLYGALCDGSTDDTIAVQAALTANTNVYFPTGTCIVSNVTIANDGTNLIGDGVGSVIQMKSGSTGAMIAAGSNRFTMSYLNFYGGDDTSKQAVSSSTANRTAFTYLSQLNSQADHLTVHGFANYGFYSADTSRDLLTHLKLSNSTFYNNWDNFDGTTNFQEYVQLVNVEFHDSYYGLAVQSGNFQGSNLKIIDNGYGVYVNGNSISNNGHGNINSSQINHNTTNLFTDAVSIGFNFIGDQFFEGPIYLKNSTGINIAQCEIAVSAYDFEGGGINYIRDNFTLDAYGSTVNHSFNGSADATLMINNYKSDGNFTDGKFNVVSGIHLYAQNGNIGLGTVNPTQKLEVMGTVKATRFVGDGSGLTGIIGGSTQWTGSGTGPLSYSGGNVGIGTIAPIALLDVFGSVNVNDVGSGGGQDSNTLSLLHMNGSNGSTTFTDSATSPVLTWTAHGSTLSTSAPKFGSANGSFASSGSNYIDTTDNAIFTLGSGDFDFSLWVKRNTTGTDQYVFAQMNSSATASTKSVYLDFMSGNNKIEAAVVSGSTAFTATSSQAITDTTTWHWVHFWRSGNTLSCNIDGVAGTSANVTGVTVNDSTNNFAIGRPGEVNTLYFDGSIDEFMFSNVARADTAPSAEASPLTSGSPSLSWVASRTQSAKIWTDGTNSGSLKFDTSATHMTMLSGGNVGIGSLLPGQALDVQGTVRASIGFAVGTNIGVTGSGAASCLCKAFTNGICTSLGTCS